MIYALTSLSRRVSLRDNPQDDVREVHISLIPKSFSLSNSCFINFLMMLFKEFFP